MQTDTPMLDGQSEVSLAKHMVVGALCGMVGWAIVTLVVARLGWPDESWGFTLTLCVFSGLWVGPFFGSAAGVAVHHLRTEADEAAAHDHAPTRSSSHETADAAPLASAR